MGTCSCITSNSAPKDELNIDIQRVKHISKLLKFTINLKYK